MKVNLYIGNELADFNERFNVMFSIGDIRDVSYGNNNTTYTLRLPLTKTNKRLLSFINQADVKSEPDKIGRLYLGEQLIISGKIIITGYNEYSASIIISSDDWIGALKEKKMSELDLSAYDHLLNHANVEDSWSAVYPFYRYPMINFGALALSETGVNAKWSPNDFIPMFQVTGLMTKILEPYNIVSAFIDSIKDLYVVANEKLSSDSHISNKAAKVQVAYDDDNKNSQTLAPSATLTTTLPATVISFDTAIDNQGSHFSGGGQYTVPETGTYRFKATIKLRNTAFVGNSLFTVIDESYDVKMKITRGGSTIIIQEATSPIFTGTELLSGAVLSFDSGYYHFVEADVVTMEVSMSCRATNIDIDDQVVEIGVSATSDFYLVWDRACLHSGLTKTIQAEEIMPNMSQLDFLAAIRDIFNLRFFMDKSRGTIYIEPWDQFLSSTVVDLSPYVDHETIDTEIISGSYYENTLYKWKDDSSDALYEEYLKWAESPGTKTVTLGSIYTKPGEDIREHSFSSIITAYNNTIGEYSVLVPSILTAVVQAPPTVFNRKVGFNTRIVEWKGMTSGFTWYYETEAKTEYPKIQGLDWSEIYNSYWQRFFRYVDKGKLYTFRIKINPMFISQFFTVINSAASEGFRPTYKIRVNGIENYFFLQKITTDGVLAECEMILKQ